MSGKFSNIKLRRIAPGPTLVILAAMKLDEVQQAAQEQFARQSHRYGRGHVLEDIENVRLALDQISLPKRARVLDVATGAGHTGLFVASLGHDVTLADIAQPMLERAARSAVERGLQYERRSTPPSNSPTPTAILTW